MPYIIENAEIIKENEYLSRSLIADGGIISAIQPKLGKISFMKMNISGFLMTPSYIVLNSAIDLEGKKGNIREYSKEHLLRKGCTAMVTYCSVLYERELKLNLTEMEHCLRPSLIDYTIGVRISLELLTPSFLRICKKEKISAVFVELNQVDSLDAIPWSRIREAMFPYNMPLIPIILAPSKNQSKILLAQWNKMIIKEKIPALPNEIEENRPLSASEMNRIGFYPSKGSLMHRSELSYNLYLKSPEMNKVSVNDLFFDHNEKLAVTVQKGKVVRAGSQYFLEEVEGEYFKAKTHSFFSI